MVIGNAARVITKLRWRQRIDVGGKEKTLAAKKRKYDADAINMSPTLAPTLEPHQ
jgi:hypothetical protein